MHKEISNYHRYIGFWVGENHFLEKPDYLKAINLESFDPEECFLKIYDYFFTSNQPKELIPLVEFTIHFSNINGLLSQPWFLDSLLDVHSRYSSKFSLSVHIPFADYQIALTDAFIPTLVESLQFCEKIRAGAIVIHPPRTKNDTSDAFIDQLLSPLVLNQLRKYPMFIAIENAQDSGCYFQSMEHLVKLREKLVQKLDQISASSLASCFTFCFDTGHYLLYQFRDGNLTSDWDTWCASFLPYVSVTHIHANDSSRDQHIIPYLESPYPEDNYPFEFKQYFENCHRVMLWLKILDENWSEDLNKIRYHVLETNAPYSWKEMAAFWERWAKKIALI